MFKKVLLFLAFAFPFAVSAASIHIGDYFLKGGENAPDDVYAIGKVATFAGSVEGDAISVGRTIFSQSTISGDALFIGEEVRVEGRIQDDARLVGNVVTIDGEVTDDVVAIGSKIIINRGARVGGSFYAAGGEVDIRGTIAGDARVLSGRTTVTGTIGKDLEIWGRTSFEKPAEIGGDLILHAHGRALPPVNVSITGKVILDESGGRVNIFAARSLLGGFFSIQALMLLSLAFALFFVARERSESILVETLPNLWQRALRGLLILIVLPVLVLILLPTVIGIPIAFIFGALLLLLILLSWGYAGMLLGVWSERFFFKRSAFPLSYRPVLLGCIFLSLISLIPFVGPIVHGILIVAVAGSLGTLFFRHIRAKT